MNYPILEIDVEKIFKNTKEVVERCKAQDVDVTAVTKCVGGNLEVADAFLAAGARALGDSRLSNLKLLPKSIEKWLIRIPMLSEARDTVLFSDLSLNSERKVLEALDREAAFYHLRHKVTLMIDHGDLREGWFSRDDFLKDLEHIKNLKNLEIVGIGTNSNCAGAIIPEPGTFSTLEVFKEDLKNVLNIKNPILSGGNSGAYYMVENQTLPESVTNLRLGELLLFGHETSFGKAYPYLNQEVFELKAEIIELKEKPSYPIGQKGKDAFGKEPIFFDKGIRKRAILGIGKQDIPPENVYPVDQDIEVVTASSDHLIIDVTDSKKSYKVGDIITFWCDYASALRASTSDYINKKILKRITS